MDCCEIDAAIAETRSKADEFGRSELGAQRCPNCGAQGRPVSRKTIVLMLKPELLEQPITGTYTFCLTRNCPVVYFADQGDHSLTIDALRIRVGIKVEEDPIPLCYCFGFDESHVRDQISQAGDSIQATISRLIREGLCACEQRNPAGVCCLGEVNKTANHFRTTSIHNG